MTHLGEVRWYHIGFSSGNDAVTTSKALFAALLLTYLLARQCLWSLLTPMFQAPDEVQHLAMVGWIDQYGLSFYQDNRPPWREFEDSFDFRKDYYKQKGIIWKLDLTPQYVPHSRWGVDEERLLHNRSFDAALSHEVLQHNTLKYPPLYYWVLGRSASVLRHHWNPTLIEYQFFIRLFGVVFYLAFLLVFVLALRECLQGGWFWLVFGMTVLHPMLTFMSAICNNDSGLLVFVWGQLLCLLKILKRADRPTTWVLLAVSVCGIVLVKGQGALFSMIVLSAAGLIVLLYREWLRTLNIVGTAVLLFVTHRWVSLFCGSIFIYGETENIGLVEYLRKMYSIFGWRILKNNVGQMAWFEVEYPDGIYYSFLGLGCVIFLYWLYRSVRWAIVRAGVPLAPLLGAVYLAYACGFLVYQFLQIGQIGFFVQGRHFLAALPIAYILVGLLLQELCQTGGRAIRLGAYGAAGVLLGYLLFLNNYALYLVLERFYLKDDVAFGEALLRMMQYKPLWFKSSACFWGLISTFALTQVALVLFGILAIAQLLRRETA